MSDITLIFKFDLVSTLLDTITINAARCCYVEHTIHHFVCFYLPGSWNIHER